MKARRPGSMVGQCLLELKAPFRYPQGGGDFHRPPVTKKGNKIARVSGRVPPPSRTHFRQPRVGPASVLVAGGTGPHADTPARCQVDVIPPHLWPPPETRPTARIVRMRECIDKRTGELRERNCE